MYRATETTYPLLCMQGIGPATKEELDEIARAYARAFERGGPIVCISDSRRSSHDAMQRRILGDWANFIKKHYGSRMLGVVVVLDSSFIRGALTAINWLSPPTIPQPTASDIEEAIALAKKMYERQSVAIAPAVWGQARVWFEQGLVSESRG